MRDNFDEREAVDNQPGFVTYQSDPDTLNQAQNDRDNPKPGGESPNITPQLWGGPVRLNDPSDPASRYPRPNDKTTDRWVPPTHQTVERKATWDRPVLPTYSDKQKEERGQADRYHRRYYVQNRAKIKRRSERWYDRKKNLNSFEKDQQLRRDHPEKYKRNKARGYRTDKERTQDWRDSQAALFERRPPDGPQEKRDRATSYQGEEVKDPMFQNRDFSPIQTGFRHERLDRRGSIPRPLLSVFAQLIKMPLWKRYLEGRVSDPTILDWFDAQGFSMSLGDWEGLKTQAFEAFPLKRTAASVEKILRFCRRQIKDLAAELSPAQVRVDRKNNVWLFDVVGQSGNTYRVRVKIKGLIHPIRKAQVQLSCSCPFWRWQGAEHWGTQEDYQYGKLQGTATFPIVRDPKHKRAACKHVVAALNLLIERYSKGESVKRVASAYLKENGIAGF